MLSKADDFPIHQNPEPIAYAGVSRNFYDRYFFNGYHLEEDLFSLWEWESTPSSMSWMRVFRSS